MAAIHSSINDCFLFQSISADINNRSVFDNPLNQYDINRKEWSSIDSWKSHKFMIVSLLPPCNLINLNMIGLTTNVADQCKAIDNFQPWLINLIWWNPISTESKLIGKGKLLVFDRFTDLIILIELQSAPIVLPINARQDRSLPWAIDSVWLNPV